jgi:anaerobic ribonucleoside-triphosphate reductase activating protein
MRVLKIDKENILNGPGVRLVVWLSGCTHNCPGCQNPWTHDPNIGTEHDEDTRAQIMSELENDIYDGVTFSGGDPLHKNNREGLLELCKSIKAQYPDLTIWVWTGYTWEGLLRLKDKTIKELLSTIDVLVDGKFKQELYDP